MTILDGKKTSNDIKDEIANQVNTMKSKGEKVPHLAAILVGTDYNPGGVKGLGQKRALDCK